MSDCGSPGSSIIKSPLDENDYSFIELENGLKVLLFCAIPHENTLTKEKINPKTGVPLEVEEFNRKFVHIPDDEDNACGDSADSDDAGCWEPAMKKSKLAAKVNRRRNVVCVSLCVGAGSLNDPEDCKGMAHFCEHMICTYGSNKFPAGLMDFVNSQMGFMNATTYANFTQYYYALLLESNDVGMHLFKQSLAMLADMMISPNFPPEKFKDEIQTVDSEFTLSETRDGNRLWQLFCSVFPENHPLHAFGCGNRATLANPDLQQRLCDWKTRHYAANYMTLVISAALPLDDLEAMARENFSLIPKSNDISRAEELVKSNKNPFKALGFNRFYRVVPFHDIDIVWITWAMEDTNFAADFRTKPALYLATALEGVNPLTDYLKKNNWMFWLDTDYDSGTGLDLFCSPFSIYIALTDLGVKEIFNVLKAVLSYLKLLGNQKPSEDLFNEIRRRRAEYFHYNPVDWYDAIDLSANLQRVKNPKYILTSKELVTDFDPKLIQDYIRGLTPFNMNVILASKLHADQCTKKEKYYGTKYCDYNFLKSYLKSCQKNMGFKVERDFLNPFRVKNIICPVQNLVGQNYLKDDRKARILHWKRSVCSVGELPFTVYIFFINTPSIPMNERSRAFMSIWSFLLFENLEKQIFQCSAAGFLVHQVQFYSSGIFVVYSGKYSPKMPELIKTFFHAFMNLENIVTEERFLAFLAKYRKSVNDDYTNPFYDMTDTLLSVVLQNFEKTPQMKPIANGFGFQDFKNFLHNFKEEMLIEGFLLFCVPDDQARRITKIIGSLNYREYPEISNPRMSNSRVMMWPHGEKCIQFKAKALEMHANIVWNYYQIGMNNDWVALVVLDHLLSGAAFKQLRTEERLSYYASGFVTLFAGIGISILVVPQAAYHSTGYVDERIDKFLIGFRHCIANYNALIKVLPNHLGKWYTEDTHKLLLDLYDNSLLPSSPNRRKITFQLIGNPGGGHPVEAQGTQMNLVNNIDAFKNSMCIYNIEDDGSDY